MGVGDRPHLPLQRTWDRKELKIEGVSWYSKEPKTYALNPSILEAGAGGWPASGLQSEILS